MICFTWALEACAGFQIPDVPLCRPLRIKTETKDVKGVGRVTLSRANPVCVKEVGAESCLFCVSTVSGKEQYVGDGVDHLLDVGGKRKTASMIMREGAIMPIESWVELRTSVVNQCKAAGCSAPEVARWKAKAVRLQSITEGFGLP